MKIALFLVILHSFFQQAFAPALPGYEFQFPRDHGSHQEYRTEWWYYSGHLRTTAGHRYGFELTFFRVGVAPPDTPAETPWDLRNLALAHFAITDVDRGRFRYHEKLNRQSRYTAAAAAGSLDLFNEGWRATTLSDGSWRIVAFEGTDAIDLNLRARKPPAIHGESAGHPSHYYSMTRLEAAGSINGQHCSGTAWMDHEFGGSTLRETQRGWDWFSVQLDNETELMFYQLRRRDGTADPASSGSLITSDGSVIHIRRDQMRIEPTGRWKSYPMGWRLVLPTFGINLVLRPVMKNQELVTRASTQVTYWEGAVDVSGSSGNVAVSGVGYVEMTGYAR